MEKDSFEFILKSGTFSVPSIFKHLVNIPTKISKSLVFDNQHQYKVESDVSEEVFQSFLNYLINDTLPDIQINNFNEFLQLNQEFQLLDDIIEEKKKQFGEYLINLSGIKDNKNTNYPVFTEKIAMNLDDYIDKYGQELIKLPIQTLHIIFNHHKRYLTQHDIAYDLIKQHFEQTRDANIFVLLESLEGSKLSKSNIEECFKLRELRCNHMPSIDFTYLSDSLEKINKLEEKFSEFQNKYESEKILLIQNYEKNKEEIMIKHENEINNVKNEILKEIKNEINNFQNKYESEKKALIEEHEKDKKEIVLQHKKEISDIQKNYSDEIKQLNDKIKSLEIKLNEIEEKNEKKFNSIQENHIEQLKNNQSLKSNSFEKSFEFQKQMIYAISIKSNFITAEMSFDKPGILHQLKMKEKTPFDKLFIPSQSSRDIYNIIDPNTKDDFRSSSEKNDFIEFYLKQKVTINGIKIFSSFEYFPKSFDIEVDGVIVKSINDANELNGSYSSMTINFDPVLAQKVRFNEKGPNWDKNSNFIRIKRIELLSNEPEYSNGVFSKFIEKSENNDPHKCPIVVSASHFNLHSFHLLNVQKGYNTNTYDSENSWFQIELTQSFAILIGFRLNRCEGTYTMKQYKIICTDDVNKPEDSWITLININEENDKDHKILDIYEFDHPSPPVKLIRIKQTGKTWSNDNYLGFYHFDLFGTYL